MQVLVVGGSGVISRAIVRELLAAGHGVSVFNRGNRPVPDGVRQITGDRQLGADFVTRMRRERFDAVIDMISYTEADARVSLEAFGGNTGHLVVCSTIAAYVRPFAAIPATEASERLWESDAFPYGFQKANMERFLLPGGHGHCPVPGAPAAARSLPAEAHGTPITIIRPSLTFGEGSANVGVLRQNRNIVDRLRRGKALISFGDGKAPWSFTFAPDLARGFVLSLGRPATFGKAYHVTSEERHVWDDLYRAFGAALGVAPDIRHLPAELLHKARPALFEHLLLEKSWPGVFDCTAFRRDVPEFRADISLESGVAALVEWFERETALDPDKAALEDSLVALWDRWATEIAEVSA